MTNCVTNIIKIKTDSDTLRSDVINQITSIEGFLEDSDDDGITFITYDKSPYWKLITISVKYPSVIFNIAYADEDLGVNVGKYKMVDGEVTNVDIPDALSEDAYDMSIDITGDDYYVTDFLLGVEEYEIDHEFPKICLNLAYNREIISETTPQYILKRFEQMAVANEEYEFAAKIIKLIK